MYKTSVPFMGQKGFIDALRCIGYRIEKRGLTYYIEKSKKNMSAVFCGPIVKSSTNTKYIKKFFESYPPQIWSTGQNPQIDLSHAKKLVCKARSVNDLEDFIEYISRALVFSSDELIESVLIDCVLPVFFERYPDGTLLPVAVDYRVFKWVSLVSALAVVEKFGGSVRSYMDPNLGLGTLRESHPDALPRLRSLLSLGLSFFYPYIYGFVVECRPGLLFTFLFDDPYGVVPLFPWDMFDVIRQTSLLEEHTSDTVLDMMRGTASQKTIHKRYCYPKIPSQDIQKWFIYWTKCLDSLIKDTLDFTNFVKDGRVMHVEQLKYLYSLDRVFSNALLVNSDRNPMVRKTLTMQILDIISNIVCDNSRNESDAFRYFLLESTYRQYIQPVLATLPTPIRNYLLEAAETIHKDVRDVALSGIWIRKSIDKLTEDEYAARILRAIRNSHHGYKIRDFDSLLIEHTGNISNYFPDISSIFVIAITTSPSDFRIKKWGFR